MIVTHPNNRRYLESLSFEQGVGPLPTAIDPLHGIPITFDRYMPERSTRQVWHAPPESRFACYGPEDEEWMRPLGIGYVVTMDDGPLFYEIADPFPRGGFRFGVPVNSYGLRRA